MKTNYEYLKDTSFLEELSSWQIQTQFIKITLLTWNEKPIKEIQGISTGGTINIDGNSSVRRTCNLSIAITDDGLTQYDNFDNLFSLNKKIYFEVGLENKTKKYNNYDIIWIPQGVYVITGCSINKNSSGINMSLQLKDKMCLLNGEAGGAIPASTQFDQYETIDENGEWIIQKPCLTQIIRELVNHFGGEQLGKIIISDLDNRIKKVMKWNGNTSIYLVNENNSYRMTTNLGEVGDAPYTEFMYGEDVGYIFSDFYYPGELIANAGDNVCTILDKIKNLLGNFEYFYDLEGNFRFQEKKNYLNNSLAKFEIEKLNKDNYLLDMDKGKIVYNFVKNKNLISSFSNNPQLQMIKNDFIVWGVRKNANGNDIPIRYHLAIDKKPKVGNIYECFTYEDPDDNLIKSKVPIKYSTFSELNKNQGAAGNFYMTIDDGKIYKWDSNLLQYIQIDISLSKVKTSDWRSELYLQGTQAEPFGTNSNYYYTELLNEWPKIYNLYKDTTIVDKEEIFIGDFYDEVKKTPSDIDYFLDFIDTNSKLSNFSVDNIGRRSIVVTDNDINCIFEPYIPDFIIIEAGQPDTEEKRKECEKKGQKYIQVSSSIFNLLITGGNSNSAYNKVRELLYQYTSYNESISLQSLPLYHIEPNTRIKVDDYESNIKGEYIISSMSIPLSVSGVMSISATKALERI